MSITPTPSSSSTSSNIFIVAFSKRRLLLTMLFAFIVCCLVWIQLITENAASTSWTHLRSHESNVKKSIILPESFVHSSGQAAPSVMNLVPKVGSTYLMQLFRYLKMQDSDTKTAAFKLMEAVTAIQMRNNTEARQLIFEARDLVKPQSNLDILALELLLNNAQLMDRTADIDFALSNLPDTNLMRAFNHLLLLESNGDINTAKNASDHLARLSPTLQANAVSVISAVSLGWQQFYEAFDAKTLKWHGVEAPGLSQIPKTYSGSNLAILTLGCPVLNDPTTNKPVGSECLQERAAATLDVANYFQDSLVVASGGGVATPYPEAQYIKDSLIANGIPSERVEEDLLARDTLGNFINFLDYVRQYRIDSVVVVTSTWHLERSRLIFTGLLESLGMNLNILYYGAGKKLIVAPNFYHDKRTEMKAVQERLRMEQRSSYRDVARSRGYFEASDF